MINEKWLIIINPNAGNGKGKKDWDKLSGLLLSAGIDYECRFTQYKNHACEIAREALSGGYRKIIVGGGDGTLNETVNGIFSQNICPTNEITLAVIPIGTGNDWRRTYNISTVYKEAVELIRAGTIKFQDVGKVTYHCNGNSGSRYFINIAGVGFDAVVVNKTNLQNERLRKKGKGNSKIKYLLNLLMYLLNYKKTICTIQTDGQIFEGKTYSIAVCIGKYNGGGMLPAPLADVDDGLFDVTIFADCTKLDVITNVKKLFNGNIYSFKKVKLYKGQNVTITSEPSVSMEADGEVLGTTPLQFEIIPHSLKIITAS